MRSFFCSFRFFLAAFVSISGAACSGSAGSGVSNSSSSSDPASDVTGHWSGRSTSSTGFSAGFTSDLVQTGSALSGSFRSSGACIGGGKIEGTVVGDRIDATVTAGDVRATLTLTVSSDDQLDGTYDLPAAGACPSDQGSVSMTRGR